MSTPHRYTEQSPHIAIAAFRTRSAVFGITDTLDVVERDAEVSELVRERCLFGHLFFLADYVIFYDFPRVRAPACLHTPPVYTLVLAKQALLSIVLEMPAADV